ncbi:unannotated protein [freshwater metagenome]|uniref:Unannotated protein n=1 Tax=freshwater metagenome TaxID=449393 RepID=A0A6J7IQU3_9ZZZZ
MDDVPFLRVRLLGVGTVGSVAVRRHSGGRRLLHLALTRGVPSAARGRTGDGAQSDSVGVLPTVRGRSHGGLDRRRAVSALRDLRRRGPRTASIERLVRAARRSCTAADQHVRHHRDHGARVVSGAGLRVRRNDRIGGRQADRRAARLCSRYPAPSGPGRGARRDVRCRWTIGARIPGTRTAHRGAVRGRSVRLRLRCRVVAVSHRRSGAVERVGRARISGPLRRSGQGARLPNRVGRGRGRGHRAPRRHPGCRRRP